MAAYAYSTYTVWDPKRPWKWGLKPDSNPRRIGSTSKHVLRANAMLVAPDGHHMIVGGEPHGRFAVYDFTTRKIVYRADYAYGVGYTYGSGHLHHREADGKIYAAMGRHVVRIDPATRAHEVIATHPGLGPSTVLADQWLYGSHGTHLVRLRLD